VPKASTRARMKQNTRKPATQKIDEQAKDIWRRTRLLVEVIVRVMEKEVRDLPDEPTKQWKRLFGEKDSAVMNLQKLVKLLAELQIQAGDEGAKQDELVEPVSPQELALLSQWLGQANESRAAPEEAR